MNGHCREHDTRCSSGCSFTICKTPYLTIQTSNLALKDVRKMFRTPSQTMENLDILFGEESRAISKGIGPHVSRVI